MKNKPNQKDKLKREADNIFLNTIWQTKKMKNKNKQLRKELDTASCSHVTYTLNVGEIKGLITQAHQQATEETVEKIRKSFVELAIQGGKDRDELKGLLLYARTLNYLDTLTKNDK